MWDGFQEIVAKPRESNVPEEVMVTPYLEQRLTDTGFNMFCGVKGWGLPTLNWRLKHDFFSVIIFLTHFCGSIPDRSLCPENYGMSSLEEKQIKLR